MGLQRGCCTEEAPISPESIADALVLAALEKKALEPTVLDMRRLIDYSDIFVICTATNGRQVQAIADEAKRVAKHELDLEVLGVEGYEGARWVLVDVGSVILHVFDGSQRGFYDLDGLWADAPRLPLPEGAEVELTPLHLA